MADNNENLIKKYQKVLESSKTAYNPGLSPTKSDINTQRQLYKLQNIDKAKKSEELKKQWYTDRKSGDNKGKEGLIGKALNLLATPGYAVTGAIESALGRGSEDGLLENIKANIKEEGTMGDLLRGYGVNNLVAMPLGLALDIALDPVAWATLGTSAIIPRTVIGASKAAKAGSGAIKGAKLGLESSLLGKAAWTGKALSKIRKTGSKVGINVKSNKLSKFAGLRKSIEDKAILKSKEFDELTGESLDSIIKGSQKERFFDKVSNKLEETPTGRGLKKLFGGRNEEQFKGSLKEDTLALKQASKDSKNMYKKDLNDAAENMFARKGLSPQDADAMDVANKLKAEGEAAKKMSKDVSDSIKEIKRLLVSDTEHLSKLVGLNKEELTDTAKLFKHYSVQLDNYDTKVAKILLGEKSRKVFKAYATYVGWFKNMKIGGNVAAFTNSLVGNIAMTSMVGIDVTSAGFARSMKNAASMAISKDYKHLKPFMDSKEWRAIIEKYPKTFESIFGVRAKAVLGGRKYIEDMMYQMNKSGKFKSMDIENMKDAYEKASKLFTKRFELSSGARATINAASSSSQNTFLSSEIMIGPYTEFLETLRKSNNPAKRFLHKAATVPMEAYNKVDQSYRVGLALNLTKEGVTRKELKLLAKRFSFRMDDVIESGGKYKFSPLKAMELAQETYMNYAAMPAFVQIMRTLPVAGFPFVSFAYGMTGLAAKTAMYNPEFYNKVSYMLHEISGQKSPLEKQALESGYYDWMKKPGMIKVPFFEENPIYMNVANMIPHYTMNILQDSERSYNSRFGNQFANMLDKLPFFKTPEGQVLLDYVVMPTMLQGERPQGMFGQPLWEKDAGILKKAGYATRSLVESAVPPAVGFAGGLTRLGIPPEKALPLIPSYRFRSMGYAAKGKSGIGSDIKISPTEKKKQIRSSMMGLPYYPVNLQYSEFKKKKK